MNSIEFCAGAGGQALGLEQAGFSHSALVEIEPDYAATLSLNRPNWDVRCADMNGFDGRPFEGYETVPRASLITSNNNRKPITHAPPHPPQCPWPVCAGQSVDVHAVRF